eukprot:Sdes_comp20219_c0_seq1m13596
MKIFFDKFYEKTLNHWENRQEFKKHDGNFSLTPISCSSLLLSNYSLCKISSGKYDMIKIEEGKDCANQNQQISLKKKQEISSTFPLQNPALMGYKQCTLENSLQKLMELIFNYQQLEDIASSLNYDFKKAPLGKLSQLQIQQGYKSLQTIEKCICKTKKTASCSPVQLFL